MSSQTSQATQYDSIGKLYDKTKEILPYQTIIKPNLRAAVGKLSNQTVLDLACGTGHSTQQLLAWGAAHVVGVDISREMIREARESMGHYRNVDFRIGDVTKPLSAQCVAQCERFDVVVGSWLLHYAANEEELVGMWKNIVAHLKPGGRFVGIVPNPALDLWGAMPYDKYGVRMELIEGGQRVSKIRVTLGFGETVSFETSHFRETVYEETAQAAGMGELLWMPMELPEGVCDDDGYFNMYLLKPHASICVSDPILN